jgi:hypothetical protein
MSDDDAAAPIQLRLSCPACGVWHIDEGAAATRSHRTHACQHCGNLWAPAVVATVGVKFLPGCKDPARLPSTETRAAPAAVATRTMEGLPVSSFRQKGTEATEHFLARIRELEDRLDKVVRERDEARYAATRAMAVAHAMEVEEVLPPHGVHDYVWVSFDAFGRPNGAVGSDPPGESLFGYRRYYDADKAKRLFKQSRELGEKAVRHDAARAMAFAAWATAEEKLDRLHLMYMRCAQCALPFDEHPGAPPHCDDCVVDAEHLKAWDEAVGT